ncbi:MAG TPA: dihydrodipicolinate synthase family protein [Gemmatimonadaceae bacterium]|nr:dihydrodipicolinate synthase family protein [Gemmatimonadaceae bacterium]
MEQQHWQGVFAAITTPFAPDLSVDHSFLAEHASWLVDNGCTGIVALGSLGESATLAFDEKVAILETCREGVGDRVPVVAGIAGLSTSECVALARRAAAAGCRGLMVLPPYVYRGDWRETEAHFSAVIEATPLSCMLYNNPIAYGTDVTADQLATLVRHDNLHAVKESSGDVRRVTAVFERLGDRLRVFAGLDDMIVESIAMGAEGWIAGLVNALPAESVAVFELAAAGRWEEARALYDWFLPLLRLDTHPKFVQYIKLVQAEVGKGGERVRPPRLEVEGAERDAVLALVRARLASRPSVLREADDRGRPAGSRGGSRAAAPITTA